MSCNTNSLSVLKIIYSLCMALLLLSCSVLFLNCEGDAGNLTGSDTEQPVVDYSLAPGVPFRIISPNGGEQITYGSTITVEWVMNVNLASEAVIVIDDGSSAWGGCSYNGSSSEEWFVYPRDLGVNGVKKMSIIDENLGVVYGSLDILVKDTLLLDAGCNATFEGTNMRVQVYDPYGDEKGCEECYTGDYSDMPFEINGKM